MLHVSASPVHRATALCFALLLVLISWQSAYSATPTVRPKHWAYQPIERPAVPNVRNEKWPVNAIDRFVLARLEREGLAPASQASAAVLLRRVSFDLTGLPPSVEQINAFVARGDKAWQETTEQLLASRAYGEQWARHWMDVARYADSAGYELDYQFTEAWKYRDYLIRSFQSNKPLDRFIHEQIAGDQMWPGSSDAADGALFLAIGPRRHEGGIQRAAEREYEWFTDLADTTGAVFLGSTLACSRCHDHKFDPFTQRDYFGLQAIFADSELEEKHVGPKPGDAVKPASLRAIPRKNPTTLKVLRRGELDAPLEDAPPALPAFLPDGGKLRAEGSARRSTLAHWLTSPRNPLTARVMVNRVWQWHFGAGLVRTPNDFGVQGERATHPELLDWLASELICSGWDLHHLHRLILDSATYRMSSICDEQSQARDADGRLLSHFPRRRLTAEELRDSMLAVAGKLNPKAFGEPVVVPVEKSELAGLNNMHWDVTRDPSEHLRRSIYLIVRRSVKLNFFDAFNAPDTAGSCAVRDRSVVALQALTLLNGPQSLDVARGLAGRLWRESEGDADRAVSRAWPLLFGRAATDAERSGASKFLAMREADWLAHRAPDGALPTDCGDHLPAPARGAAWVEWCLALLNANEFIYVD